MVKVHVWQNVDKKGIWEYHRLDQQSSHLSPKVIDANPWRFSSITNDGPKALRHVKNVFNDDEFLSRVGYSVNSIILTSISTEAI